MMANATLSDVARLAGVSPITASRAIRNSPQVTEATREKVRAAAASLNYTPNSAARALATGHSGFLAVLIPSVTNAVFADVLSGAFSVADDLGLTLQLVNTGYSAQREEDALRLILNQRPSGIIVSGTDQTDASRRMLEGVQVPLVQIMDLCDDPIDMMVGFSHAKAAAAAAAHLLDMGYRHPAALAAQLDPRTIRRMAGFSDGLRAAGHPEPDRIQRTDAPSGFAVGGQLLRDLMARRPDTDCVFCNNDDLAIGALFEAQRLGLSVPHRLGICGFNNLEAVGATEPGITSVKTNRFEMGRLAVQKVSRIAGTKDATPQVVDLGFEVIARASTRRTPTAG
ncbi:MAG: LacI family DNA-binding transcriptional regulator [Alphaproteobacteria bacterium]|nr:LacI family DNA-binding transcriptional regulator [Alphaproteobacteria bacterium]